jgi:hypothetical protein
MRSTQGFAPGQGQQCRASYDYVPQASNQISLKRGQLINVISFGEKGQWSNGINIETGASGFFPSDYVERIPIHQQQQQSPIMQQQQQQQPQQQQQHQHQQQHPLGMSNNMQQTRQPSTAVSNTTVKARVKFNYAGDKPNEMRLNAGEIVDIVTVGPPGGWCRGLRGAFPTDYVEILANQPIIQPINMNSSININQKSSSISDLNSGAFAKPSSALANLLDHSVSPNIAHNTRPLNMKQLQPEVDFLGLTTTESPRSPPRSNIGSLLDLDSLQPSKSPSGSLLDLDNSLDMLQPTKKSSIPRDLFDMSATNTPLKSNVSKDIFDGSDVPLTAMKSQSSLLDLSDDMFKPKPTTRGLFPEKNVGNQIDMMNTNDNEDHLSMMKNKMDMMNLSNGFDLPSPTDLSIASNNGLNKSAVSANVNELNMRGANMGSMTSSTPFDNSKSNIKSPEKSMAIDQFDIGQINASLPIGDTEANILDILIGHCFIFCMNVDLLLMCMTIHIFVCI